MQTRLLWTALALAAFEAPGSVQYQICPHWWRDKLKAEPGQWICEENPGWDGGTQAGLVRWEPSLLLKIRSHQAGWPA